MLIQYFISRDGGKDSGAGMVKLKDVSELGTWILSKMSDGYFVLITGITIF